MNIRRVLALTTSIGVASVLALGSSALGRGKTETVDVGDDFFAPATLTIREGTTVDFDWVGDGFHDVVGEGPGRDFESPGQQGSGVLYSKRFTRPGNYSIICTYHLEEGMAMDLRVKKKRRN